MEPQNRPLVGPLVIFMLTAVTAIILLLTALVVWLSYVFGTIIGTCIVLGCIFAILAIMIYLLAIRDSVRNIREHIATIYEVAYAARVGYQWAVRLFYGAVSKRHSQ